MFELSSGLPRGRQVAKAVRALAAPFVVAAVGALQAGCASDNTAYAAAPTVAAYAERAPEVEADGLPSQAAPLLRIHQLPDDPSQPFSRNYGGPNPAAMTTKTPPRRTRWSINCEIA